MTIKQYTTIRIILAIGIGIIFSQSIIFNNLIIPLTTVIIAMTVLLVLRRRVKEVMADERDYQIAGKAGRFALTTMSIIGSLAVIILFSLKHKNDNFEIIGSTIAYMVCSLLLLNNLFFQYFSQPGFWKKNILKTVIWILLVVIFIISGIKLFSNEDSWICNNGQWEKHGQPSQPVPSTFCE